MMLRVFVVVTAAIGLVLSSANAAPVMGKKNPRPAARTNKALTTGECKGLGGSVVVTTSCGMFGYKGKGCQTIDKDGVIRLSCIDEIKH
jgi:hypothetical protein